MCQFTLDLDNSTNQVLAIDTFITRFEEYLTYLDQLKLDHYRKTFDITLSLLNELKKKRKVNLSIQLVAKPTGGYNQLAICFDNRVIVSEPIHGVSENTVTKQVLGRFAYNEWVPNPYQADLGIVTERLMGKWLEHLRNLDAISVKMVPASFKELDLDIWHISDIERHYVYPVRRTSDKHVQDLKTSFNYWISPTQRIDWIVTEPVLLERNIITGVGPHVDHAFWWGEFNDLSKEVKRLQEP